MYIAIAEVACWWQVDVGGSEVDEERGSGPREWISEPLASNGGMSDCVSE